MGEQAPWNERDTSQTRPTGKGGSFVPKKPKSDTILECYRRAEEARRMADAATSQFERADFLDVAQRWLSLARSPQLCSDWAENDEATGGRQRSRGAF
jgi:hypothetical protein